MSDFWRLYVQSPLSIEADVADCLERETKPLSVAIGEIAESPNPTGSMADLGHIECLYDHPVAAHEMALLLAGLGFPSNLEVKVEVLRDRDWVTESLRTLPIVTSKRFVIHGAHLRNELPKGFYPLQVEAGLAFGTGHHDTTLGCLLALEKVHQSGFRPKHILDVGTGTGILAMAAARLFSGRVIASDIDHLSVRFARQTLDLNGYQRIRLHHAAGTQHRAIQSSAPFDLITANILANPLIAMAKDIVHVMTPGGQLILAGLLHWQFRRVLAAYQSVGLRLLTRQKQGDWSILTLEKP